MDSTDIAARLDDLARAIEDLGRRLHALEDRAAIQELTAEYNLAFDDHRPADYAGTFTPDGALQLGAGGAVTQGRAALEAFSRDYGFGLVHSTVDPVIRVEGDRARQVCNLVLTTRSRDGAEGTVTLSNTGRYEDTLVRTADGWRFLRRVWHPDQALPE